MSQGNAMQFEKRNFMGIELDVLVGHPEHDLLFVATQAAKAAGLKYASQSVAHVRGQSGAGRQLQEIQENCISEAKPEKLRKDAVLFTEAEVYQMLLRGNAPQSEPFRKWVTEEVLPSIRKTGKYNAEDSAHPIAQSIMDELKCLRSDIAALRQELSAKTFSLEAPVVAVEPVQSPQTKKEYFFTPIGIVEPCCYISKPDYGRDCYISERGKYKVHLTMDSSAAQPQIDRIVKIHEADYVKRLNEFKKNPPQMPRGKKRLQPYQGDLPFTDNGDGTVTFKFVRWARHEHEGKMVLVPLRVVDSKGKVIAAVPNISGGSEGRVQFSIVPYGWNPTVGASVKLQLEGFMLTKLVGVDDGQDIWSGQEEEVA